MLTAGMAGESTVRFTPVSVPRQYSISVPPHFVGLRMRRVKRVKERLEEWQVSKLHNCESCDYKGACATESIVPWLDEHEDEVQKACEGTSEAVSLALLRFISYSAPTQLDTEELGLMARHIFSLGYHKGRNYPSVPEVFEG